MGGRVRLVRWLQGQTVPSKHTGAFAIVQQRLFLTRAHSVVQGQAVQPVAGTAVRQFPAMQSWSALQARAQLPQCAASVWVSTQTLPPRARHSVSAPAPVPQLSAHLPSSHTCVAVHFVPHAPQFAASVFRSTHAPVHAVAPVGHAHAPSVQVCPRPQAVPQAPQFRASVLVSAQTPLQSASPELQEQMPAVHVLRFGTFAQSILVAHSSQTPVLVSQMARGARQPVLAVHLA